MTRKLDLITICVCVLLATGSGLAQVSPDATGIVTGTVHDQKTGEELVGANVLIMGTTFGASADLEGKYTIRGISPGTYDMRVSYVGYAPKVVKGVVVAGGKTVTLDVILGQEAEEKAKEEVVVSAERVRSTEAAVLSERKKAATIGDAISAEQIKHSPDATSSDAIKRVTGVSITDDKFVFVRGVTDRYNGTSLNGVSVTSTDTDVDRKSFSFDLIPANLLENTVVVKTATPDLPGDFSGGLVQVNTLDFPAAQTGRINLSGGVDPSTTRKTRHSPPGGGHDWIAVDDGSRALPPGNLSGNALAQELPNDWALHERPGPIESSFNASFGDRQPLGNDELGYIGAVSYRTKFLTSEFTQQPTYGGVPLFSFQGDHYEASVLWGGLLNLNYKLRGLNKLSFRNNFIQSAQQRVNLSSGLPSSGEFTRKQTVEWDQRTFYLGQLTGEHKLPMLGGLEAAWKGYYSKSKAEEPNREQVAYERGASDVYSLKDNYRTWATLDEHSEGGGLDLTYVIRGDTKLKGGGLLERRKRDYGIQAYSTDASRVSPPNYGLLVLPIDKIFAPENYGPGKFNLISVTTFTGEYDGKADLGAGYLMIDRQQAVQGQHLRLVGGVRVEDSDIVVHSIAETGDPTPLESRLAKTDWLPSVNLTWAIREKANLRLAYGRSLNRPEFREMADVLYYDFDAEQNVIGNPDLQRASIHNYDVRLEHFPRAGEVLAVSYFYKQLENAIEEELIPSPERFVRTWFNSREGRNWGWELEARKALGFLASPLEELTVTGNYTRVFSGIKYDETHTDSTGAAIVTEAERVMQGQAPWSTNLSLQYVVPRFGTAASVLYGKVGRRLEAVGDSRDQDVYEESRDLVDLSFTQNFLRRYEAKFTVKNLLGEDELLTTGPARSTFSLYARSPVYSLSIAMGL